MENGILYILQTRNGKRSPQASLRIAVSMVREKLISEREGLMRVTCSQLQACLHPMLDPQFRNPEDPKVSGKILGKGLAASGGAVTGQIVFTCDEAEAFRDQGLHCILCKEVTSADDIAGMHVRTSIMLSIINLCIFALYNRIGSGWCADQ